MNNLQLNEQYLGGEEVAVGNGVGLSISHIGSSTMQANSSLFKLNNVLLCPSTTVTLLSVQKFCQGDNCWFKLTSSCFMVKDNLTGQTRLLGPSRERLYPIKRPSSLNKANKIQLFLVIQPTPSSGIPDKAIPQNYPKYS